MQKGEGRGGCPLGLAVCDGEGACVLGVACRYFSRALQECAFKERKAAEADRVAGQRVASQQVSTRC